MRKMRVHIAGGLLVSVILVAVMIAPPVTRTSHGPADATSAVTTAGPGVADVSAGGAVATTIGQTETTVWVAAIGFLVALLVLGYFAYTTFLTGGSSTTEESGTATAESSVDAGTADETASTADADPSAEPETTATSESSDAGADADAPGEAGDDTTQPRAAEEEAEPPSKASVELFEDEGGSFRWRLRHTNGNIIADSGQGYASTPGVKQAAKRLREVADEADTLDYEPAAFELHEDEDEDEEWHWLLRHANGQVLGESYDGYSSRSNARKGIERTQRQAQEEHNFEGYVEDDAFRWRLTGANGQPIAQSGRSYAEEDSAREAIGRMKAYAPEADTLEYDPAAYELYPDADDRWRWRLRTMNGNIIADSGQGYSSKQKARQGMESVMTNAPGAKIGSLDEDS
jgi:uncharacterized protein YegP (UPF0339 family)